MNTPKWTGGDSRCEEVCTEVIERLEALGFDLGDGNSRASNDDHDDILNALEKVRFVRIER